MKKGQVIEAQAISMRTNYDLEMLQEVGFCSGIENYSMHLSGRKPGERPYCLIDFFDDDFVLLVDESHVTIPQIGAMYAGDRSQVNLGRARISVPLLLDNRPMNFDEFLGVTGPLCSCQRHRQIRVRRAVVAEQIIRPTGLLDPQIEIRPIKGQVEDLIGGLIERLRRRAGIGHYANKTTF